MVGLGRRRRCLRPLARITLTKGKPKYRRSRSPTRSGAAYHALNWCDSNSEGYQATFHFDEGIASFSFMLGCSCGCCLGCLGRWLFGAESMRVFMERAMRLVLASALR